jgi:hypothetical protein
MSSQPQATTVPLTGGFRPFIATWVIFDEIVYIMIPFLCYVRNRLLLTLGYDIRRLKTVKHCQ